MYHDSAASVILFFIDSSGQIGICVDESNFCNQEFQLVMMFAYKLKIFKIVTRNFFNCLLLYRIFNYSQTKFVTIIILLWYCYNLKRSVGILLVF